MKLRNLRLSSNMIGESNDETSMPHNSLVTDRKVSKFHKAFAKVHQLIKIIKNSAI